MGNSDGQVDESFWLVGFVDDEFEASSFSEAGEVLETYTIDADGSIEIGTLDYYNKFPSRFEIMSSRHYKEVTFLIMAR